MLTRTSLALCLFAFGCSSGEPSVPNGRRLTLNATLAADNGKVGFLSPAAAVIQVDVADIVGKPYLFASFPAGFSPGNDPALDSTWGTVPADLKFSYTTPATYLDGHAYDMVMLIYRTSAITDDIKAKPANEAPPAKNGDLSTFTIDMSVVRPGDPAIPAGVLRFNVDGADTVVNAQNHPVTDLSNTDALKAAFDNAIMIVP
jgi:hypothetical protein